MYDSPNKTLNLLIIVILVAFPLAAQSHSDRIHEPRNLTLCDLRKDPSGHNHELVRLSAFVTHGFEDFTLTDPSCPTQSDPFYVWVRYGGRTQSNTAYRPGETSNDMRSDSLTVDGIEMPVLADPTFQSFTNLLKVEIDTTVRAVLVGRFFSGEPRSIFVIQRVEAFVPHTRSDVDYSAEAGWYENEGCEMRSMQYLRYVSIGPAGQGIEHAIEEQRMADSGVRAWSYDDPIRVAVESLKPFYQNQVPVLNKVKGTPTREVFRWKNGKKTTTIVVTRPYWLSFFAKTNSVAWISTTIKETECR